MAKKRIRPIRLELLANTNKRGILLYIAGMGNGSNDFRLEEIAKYNGLDYQHIKWSDELNEVQKQIQFTCPFWLKPIRKFMVNFLADCLVIQGNSEVYKKASTSISGVIEKYLAEGRPVHLAGHSLGSAILIYSLYDKYGTNELPKGIKTILTFGSPLRLYQTPYRKLLHINLGDTCKWINFYNKQDIISFKLEEFYQYSVKIEDVEIKCGLPILCHNDYTKDETFKDTLEFNLYR
jgi:hypothetical protein